MHDEYYLKYGLNPYQIPAKVYSKKGKPPFTILNGSPGYINFLDAFNSWQLVKELKSVLKMPAAASFKHVSPAGAAVAVPLNEDLIKAYHVYGLELSPLATAYARARGSDRVSSYGDFIALSDSVDIETAKLISKEVSDGIIAPGYCEEAFSILKKKQNGRYIIIQIDAGYQPEKTESREVFGIVFEQKRNCIIPNYDMLGNIVTENKELPESAKRDMLISMITLKYTQSNSVCFTYDGQVIGCGAGQQSRIHCTRLAGLKADLWFLRQHPKILNLKFNSGVSRTEIDNTIDQFLRDDITEEEIKNWTNLFADLPNRLTHEEKKDWLKKIDGVSLGSDAFFPFRDNIDRAKKSGVRYVVQPGGSVRDDIVINACNEYGILMAYSNLRLFHH